MIYKPKLVADMWDTWLYYHDGTHYLYYLHKSAGGRWDGISVATSADGVHYKEIGPIVAKRDDAEWLGTGSVWKAGDRFILNFSESRDGVQAIYFAESRDLIHWERLRDEFRCDPDPRWYDDTKTGRWDCIWSLPKPGGAGFYGYLTARPWSKTPGIRFDSVGMVESADGVRWHAVEPPPFDWGKWPQMNLGEVGAIEKIGDRYYLMLGLGECLLGNRWARNDLNDTQHGMNAFVADHPEGPFMPDIDAYCLLVSNGTYFSRFYRTPDELLVTHHSIEHWRLENESVWMAPLKKAVVDGEGHLRLCYRKGNDALKGRELPIDLSRASRVYPAVDPGIWKSTPERLEVDEPVAGGNSLLEGVLNLEKGVILEGEVTIHPSNRPWAGVGFFIGQEAASGTGVLFQTRGRTEIGSMAGAETGAFAPKHRFDNGIEAGTRHDFRILLRRTLLELYLDDLLILCHSLDAKPTGKLGLIHEAGRAIFQNLQVWEMNIAY